MDEVQVCSDCGCKYRVWGAVKAVAAKLGPDPMQSTEEWGNAVRDVAALLGNNPPLYVAEDVLCQTVRAIREGRAGRE